MIIDTDNSIVCLVISVDMIIYCAETDRIHGPIIRQGALQEGCTGDQIDGVPHGGPALKKYHLLAAGIRGRSAGHGRSSD